MKNIQVIDDAINASYSIFAVTEDEFCTIFPGEGQDIEFSEELAARIGDFQMENMMTNVWDRPVDKKKVRGIHGTLFYGLIEKKKFYENKREPVINWRLFD